MRYIICMLIELDKLNVGITNAISGFFVCFRAIGMNLICINRRHFKQSKKMYFVKCLFHSITLMSKDMVSSLTKSQVVRWNIKQKKNYSERKNIMSESDIRLGKNMLYTARSHGNLTLFSVEY